MDAVHDAAKKFRDFEWRLTSGPEQTWYWWNEDHVEYKVGSYNYKPVDGLEIHCLYCPEAGSVSDRIFQNQLFSRLVLREMRQPEMERILRDMALRILREVERRDAGE